MDPTTMQCAGIQKGVGGEKRAKYARYYPHPFLRLPCTVLRGLLQEHALLNWGKDACRVI